MLIMHNKKVGKFRNQWLIGLFAFYIVLFIAVSAQAQNSADSKSLLKALVAGLQAKEEAVLIKTVTGAAIEKTFVSPARWEKLKKAKGLEGLQGEIPHTDRDMVVLRFSLGRHQWAYDLQQLYWSGANSYFSMDGNYSATDVSHLYRRVACDSEKIYRYAAEGIRPGKPSGVIETLQAPVQGLKQLSFQEWLGIGFSGIPFSVRISTEDPSVRLHSVQKEDFAGRATYKVTYATNNANMLIENRVWVCPELNYAVVRNEDFYILKDSPTEGGLEVSEWQDFQKSEEIFLPKRYITRMFSYRKGQLKEDNLEIQRDVTFDRLALSDSPPNLFLFMIPVGTVLDGWIDNRLKLSYPAGSNDTELANNWKRSKLIWQRAQNFAKEPRPQIDETLAQPLTGQELKALAEKYGFPLP